MILFDAEIARAIPQKDEDPVPGIQYCNGWRDFEGMGIACVTTFDTDTHESRVFLVDNLPAFESYTKDKVTGGFNSVSFDINLLRANAISINEVLHFDLYVEVKKAFGVKPQGFIPRQNGRWNLDTIAQATIGASKSGDGANAAIWWQQGLRGKVIDYCLRDNWLVAQLIAELVAGRSITNGEVEVRTELWFLSG